MANEFHQVSLKAIIRRADGRILCLKNNKGTAFERYYDIPGGRIKKGEFKIPFIEILKRELREELGDLSLSISDTPCALGRHWSRDGFPVIYIYFPATYEGVIDTVSTSNEHEDFAWLEVTNENIEEYFVSGILEGIRQYLNQ